MFFVLLLGIAALVGLALTSAEVFLTYRLLRGRSKGLTLLSERPLPFISILKPLCGLEDGLEANLESFATLDGAPYEVVLSVAEPNDPAIAVVESVRRRFPGAPFSLVVGGGTLGSGANPKVERLAAAARRAQGDVLFVSDSNIRVSHHDIAQTVARLSDPTVGCVSNLFFGSGARSFGAVVECLHLLTFVAPGVALANALSIPCLVGKSVAIRRDVYERIGGFAAFAQFLAEDQAMALAIREAGYRLVIAPLAVRNVISRRTVRKALDRQIRWNKIRFSYSKFTYAIEFLALPIPLSLLAGALAAVLAPQLLSSATMLSIGAIFIRLAQAVALARIAGTHSSLPHLLLAPAQEILQFAAQFAPYTSNEVRWRDHTARLGPRSIILPPHAEIAPDPPTFEIKPL